MMKWKPIATYDAMADKPERAVFWFKGTPPARGSKSEYGLQPTMQFTRYFGHRICTHWMPLPEPPKC